MYECLLKGLLGNVFRVFKVTREPPSNTQKPCLMSPDEDFKRFVAPTLGSGDECGVVLLREKSRRAERLFLFIGLVC